MRWNEPARAIGNEAKHPLYPSRNYAIATENGNCVQKIQWGKQRSRVKSPVLSLVTHGVAKCLGKVVSRSI